MRKELKKFVNKNDIKFWKDFSLPEGPDRDLIYDSLKDLTHMFIGDYYHVLIGNILKKSYI